MSLGNILKQAKIDAAKIAASGGFEVDVILTSPDAANSVTVTGIGTGTWMTFDDTEQGRSFNSSSNSIDIPEQLLIDAAYPYKNSKGYVDLEKHTVHLNDEASMTGKFVINEVHPNATLGLIVCILGKKS